MRTGLTSSQVTKNREKYGSNKLPEKKLKNRISVLLVLVGMQRNTEIVLIVILLYLYLKM